MKYLIKSTKFHLSQQLFDEVLVLALLLLLLRWLVILILVVT